MPLNCLVAKPGDQIGEAPVRESRERGVGLCEREERGGRGFVQMSFEKWFTENISVTVFLKFVKVFPVKKTNDFR